MLNLWRTETPRVAQVDTELQLRKTPWCIYSFGVVDANEHMAASFSRHEVC